LSDLKLSYVEIMCPLLSGSLVEAIRTLPDHLRTDKSLFRSIARSLSPTIDYAKYAAPESLTEILTSGPVVAFLRDELSAARADCVLPREFLQFVLAGLTTTAPLRPSRHWKRLRRLAGNYLPAWAKRAASNTSPLTPRLDFNQLAFRAHIILRMYELHAEDATSLRTISV
jgi:hypothetical protein